MEKFLYLSIRTQFQMPINTKDRDWGGDFHQQGGSGKSTLENYVRGHCRGKGICWRLVNKCFETYLL